MSTRERWNPELSHCRHRATGRRAWNTGESQRKPAVPKAHRVCRFDKSDAGFEAILRHASLTERSRHLMARKRRADHFNFVLFRILLSQDDSKIEFWRDGRKQRIRRSFAIISSTYLSRRLDVRAMRQFRSVIIVPDSN